MLGLGARVKCWGLRHGSVRVRGYLTTPLLYCRVRS